MALVLPFQVTYRQRGPRGVRRHLVTIGQRNTVVVMVPRDVCLRVGRDGTADGLAPTLPAYQYRGGIRGDTWRIYMT